MPYHNNQTTTGANGDVMLKIDPVPLREEQKFPQEKWKTFIGKKTAREEIVLPTNLNFSTAFLILVANFILATVSLALVHERLPTYAPLPDIFLDNVKPQDWALNVSEVLIMITVNFCILLVILHKHRYV